MGRKRKRLLDQLAALRAEMLPVIREAHAAQVEQKEIAEVAHYTRDAIRQMCLPPEKAEAERERRRKRTRKTP